MSTKEGEKYIGDGVYVSFDGYQFCLRAPREHGDHVVYLDPMVLVEFDAYRNLMGVKKRKVEP